MSKNKPTAVDATVSEVETKATRDNTVSAKLADNDRTVSVQYEFGHSLKESVELFGEEVVYSRFLAAAVIDLQSLIRSHMKTRTNKDGKVIAEPKDDTAIAALVAAWKPGVKQVSRKSPQDKIKDAFGGMSDEQKAEMIEQLKQQMAA